MVKDGRFKMIEYVVDGRRTTQLFDLSTDPLECRNLAGEAAHADRLAALRSRLFEWRDEWGDGDSEWGRVFWTGYDA